MGRSIRDEIMLAKVPLTTPITVEEQVLPDAPTPTTALDASFVGMNHGRHRVVASECLCHSQRARVDDELLWIRRSCFPAVSKGGLVCASESKDGHLQACTSQPPSFLFLWH
jgi:hypothetical protein